MKLLPKLLYSMALVIALQTTTFAQDPPNCPAYPKMNYLDTNCYIPMDTINLGQARITRDNSGSGNYNVFRTGDYFIPCNKPTWAIAIAHGYQLMRNILHLEWYTINSFMATTINETSHECEPGLDFTCHANYSIRPENGGCLGGCADGCYQIDNLGRATLIDFIPWRYPNQTRAEDLVHSGNFENATLSRVMYDLIYIRRIQYVEGYDPIPVVKQSPDPYGAEYLTYSAFNQGHNGTMNQAQNAFQTMRATTIGSSDWPASGSVNPFGYSAANRHYSKILGDDYTPGPGDGQHFWNYYNEQIAWSDMNDYLNSLFFMYDNIPPAEEAAIRTATQNAFNAVNGGGPISFQYEMGPVLDVMIKMMPYDEPMNEILFSSNNSASKGCQNGCIGPPVDIEVRNGTLPMCDGTSVELWATTGASYEWFRDGIPIPGSNVNPLIVTTPGSYSVKVTTSSGCVLEETCCPVDVDTINCNTCEYSVSASGVDPSCNGVHDGSVSAIVTNGPPGLVYSWTGPVNGNTLNMNNVPDGTYTITVTDPLRPACIAIASTTLLATNTIYQDLDITTTPLACGDNIDAQIVDNSPSDCDYRLRVTRTSGSGSWPTNVFINIDLDGSTTASAQPSTTGAPFLDEPFTVVSGQLVDVNTVTPNPLWFSGQLRFELINAEGNVVATFNSPNGFMLGNMNVFSNELTSCTYPIPNFTFNWTPMAGLSNLVNTNQNSNVDAQPASNTTYTVTATPTSGPACVLVKTVDVIGCSGSCTDPGTASISPSNPPAQCGGSVLLTASETNAPPAGGFEYEFFRGVVSVQGPGASNTYNATQSGSYTVVITDPADAATCTSTSAAVNVTIDATPTIAAAGPDQNLCATSANLAANTPVTGTGTWTVISGTGTFNPNANNPGANVTGLSAGVNTFRWTIANGSCPASTDDVDITSSGSVTTAAAGPDQNICATSATLAGNAVGGGETGTWTVIVGSGTFTNANDPGTNVTGLSTGTNTFRWTIDNGVCTPTTDEVDIVVDAAPTTAAAGGDQTICGTSATLAGNTPVTGTGTWTVIAGSATFTNANDPADNVTGLSVGLNTLRWTIANGSCTASTDDVDITVEAAPTTSAAGPDQNICGTNATLAGNTPATGTGTWSVVSGSATFTNANDPGTTVTALGAGANTLRWTISNGSCPPSTDDVIITTDEAPTAANAGPDQNLCADNTTMNANTPLVGTGSWSVVSGGGTFTTGNDPTTTVTGIPLGLSVYRWTISTPGVCPDETEDIQVDRTGSAAASVSINPNTPAPVCAGATFTFTAVPINEGATPNYEWFSNGVSQGVGTADTFQVVAPSNGDSLRVVMTSSLGCATGSPASSGLVTISIDNPPDASAAGTDDNVCTDNYNLSANTPVTGTGTWSVVAGSGSFSSVNDPNATVTSLGIGANTFRWTISNGTCPDEVDDVIITRSGTLTTPDAGTDITGICEDNPTSMTDANSPIGGETGSWSVASGSATFGNTADSITSITGLSTGINELVWTLDNGVCPTASDTVRVLVDTLPSAAVAGTDQSVCATSATLAATAATQGTGTWTVIAGTGTFNPNANDPGANATGLSAGVNTFRWTVTSGSCPASTDDVDITQSGTLTTSQAGTDITICETTTSQALSANAANAGNGETGTWTVIAGTGTFNPNANDPTATVSGLSTGTNTFRWTIDNGICTASTDEVDIIVEVAPIAAAAGPDQALCATSTTLAGNTPVNGTGTWTVISGTATFTNANDPADNITGLTIGLNTLRWTISTGGACADVTDDVDITVTGSAAAGVSIAASNDPSCFGNNVTFTATPTNGGTTPTYEFFVNGVSQGAPSTTDNFTTNALANGFPVSVNMTSSLGCAVPNTASASLNVTIINAPNPSIQGGNIHTCEDTPVTLTANSTGGTITWLQNGVPVGTGNTYTIDEASDAGTYTVSEDNGACPAVVSTGSVTATVDAIPLVSAGGDQTVDLGSSITLNGSGAGTPVWSPATFLDNVNQLTPTSSPTNGNGGSIAYTLTVTNGLCSASDVMTLWIKQPVRVPNAFSPNADGKNDVWQLEGVESYPKAILTVYNRWGSPVYRSRGLVVPWDGYNNGEPMPIGTYYYILELRDGSTPTQGSVTLVR